MRCWLLVVCLWIVAAVISHPLRAVPSLMCLCVSQAAIQSHYRVPCLPLAASLLLLLTRLLLSFGMVVFAVLCSPSLCYCLLDYCAAAAGVQDDVTSCAAAVTRRAATRR